MRHTRFLKRRNAFVYRSWYAAFPAFSENVPGIYRNVPGIVSVHDKDYSSALSLSSLLDNVAPNDAYNISGVFFVTMPRVAGFAFNPVSFWYIPDHDGKLRAVICEVHNTFGESHTYLCAREDGEPILPDTTLHAKKIFHVSPFFDRTGGYRFRFTLNNEKLGVYISYFGDNGILRLTASLHGSLLPLTKYVLLKAMLTNPHPALKTVILIHWQAVKLWVGKRIAYVSRLEQSGETISRARDR